MIPGQRVGAIYGREGGTVKVLGYGVLLQDEIPETAVGPLADGLREYQSPNPQIRLDNGKIVWGCECWWGAEEAVRASIEGAEQAGSQIMIVDIDEIREEYRRETKP